MIGLFTPQSYIFIFNCTVRKSVFDGSHFCQTAIMQRKCVFLTEKHCHSACRPRRCSWAFFFAICGRNGRKFRNPLCLKAFLVRPLRSATTGCPKCHNHSSRCGISTPPKWHIDAPEVAHRHPRSGTSTPSKRYNEVPKQRIRCRMPKLANGASGCYCLSAKIKKKSVILNNISCLA